MLSSLRGHKEKKVSVSNANKLHIWCRVTGDKVLKVQGKKGFGVCFHGFELNANESFQYKHVNLATKGYAQIQSGNTLKFRPGTSSNSVYMTVICESGKIICKNHEISKSCNYIINRHGGLLDAKKKKKWIDTKGHNHMLTYDDAKEGAGHADLVPEKEGAGHADLVPEKEGADHADLVPEKEGAGHANFAPEEHFPQE